jgi:error-prone DNA polymerase
MVKNGYTQEYADQLFKQIEGFGEYGFPESHAASFALLVYVSSWFKRHEPACFLAAMLNSQPMGFYGPSQLVQDAQRHGVKVLPTDVMHSDWNCTMEQSGGTQTVRLGLCMVSGLPQSSALRAVAARLQSPCASVDDLARQASLDRGDLSALACADALKSLSGHRRQQVWDASVLQTAPLMLRDAPVNECRFDFPAASEGEEVRFDYASVGLTLRSHPLLMLRKQLSKMKLSSAAQLRELPSGRLVRACGIVTVRQRPQTAKGVMFITLEDETGSVNVIVWKALQERQRTQLLHARLLAVYGVWQRDDDSGGQVRHLIAKRLEDLSDMLGALATTSRDFH